MITITTFILLSGLILWFVIGTKGYWPLKAAIIALTLGFSLFLSSEMEDLRGWPYDGTLPESFRVHWIVVGEPDKTDVGDKGAIYLWVSVPDSLPRVYRIPYTTERHEDAERALGMIRDGKKVGGKNGGKEEGKGEGDGEGKGNKGGNGGGSLSDSPEVIFHELPPPKLPEKINE
jgi:hypothetical protein